MTTAAATSWDILEGIRNQPTRYLLSTLAISIGVTALGLLIAVLSALHERSERLVQELGVNVIGILRESDIEDSDSGLFMHHARFLQDNFPSLVVSTVRSYKAPTLGTRQELTVTATDSNLLKIRNWPVVRGRFLDEKDVREGARYAVISQALGKSWGWDVGNIIYVRETPFVIVGVVDQGGHLLDSETGDPRLTLGERMVIVPNSVTPYWMTHPHIPVDAIDAIFVGGLQSPVQPVLASIQSLLTHPDQRAGRLSWITPESLLAKLNELKRTITLTAGSVAFLCLLLGGTTLMSLMVANVHERITEIGLRRALGATKSDVALLFVLEAVTVTLIAGVVGTALAHLLMVASPPSWVLPVKAGWLSLAVPPLVAVVQGVVFSYWPARMAAAIVPSEALRDE